MLPPNEIFTGQDLAVMQNWYETFAPVAEKMLYRKIPPQKVKTVFYGDSITNNFQIQEFFPGISFMNRGISGDNLAGLYFRLDVDVFAFQPEQVILLAGINGISEDQEKMMKKYEAIGDILADKKIKCYFCSVLPLRDTEKCKLFKYQEKIVELNARLKELSERKFAGYIDYHSAMKDEKGQLAEAYVKEDGLHLNFYGYCAMAKVLQETEIPL